MRGNKRKAPRSSKSCLKKRIGAKGSRDKESASDCQQDLANVQQIVPLLPNEVLDQIASYLDTSTDHRAMSLVCKNFSASAQRALFTDVGLVWSLEGSCPWMLIQFARSVVSQPHLAHHVRKLRIGIPPLDGRNPEGESRQYMRNPCVHVAGADCRLLRKAAKEAHISYPFQHDSDDGKDVFAPVARFSHAVYAMILSRVPNLRGLRMELAITGNYDSRILSESVDELVKSTFVLARKLSIGLRIWRSWKLGLWMRHYTKERTLSELQASWPIYSKILPSNVLLRTMQGCSPTSPCTQVARRLYL
jgi:hypothetical protein